MTLTQKGSTHLRKKFDDDTDASNGESVCTPRFLFVSEIGFLIGVVAGSTGSWAFVDIALGMPVPLAPLLGSLLMDVGLCCLMIKCFDLDHEPSTDADDEPEEDLEEDSFLL